jgi:fatty-acyl-CoA synthase
VAINPRLTVAEVGELISAVDVRLALIGGTLEEFADQLVQGGGFADLTVLSIDGAAFPRLDSHDANYRAAPISGQRVGLIQFTSGSTGMPKGVQKREGAVAALGASVASRWLIDRSDRLFGIFSLSHSAGTTLTLLAAFTHGASVVLPRDGWRGGAAAPLIEASGATVLPAISTVANDLIASGARPSTLRLIGGGFDPLSATRLVDTFGVDVANSYGLSEMTANIMTGDLRDSQDWRLQRFALPYPGNFARIVDEGDELLPPGGVGQIELTGWAKMKGYYGVADSDQPFTPDGWVRTGDIGTLDEQGYLMFLGRVKDIIRSGGENVTAFEIEQCLESHPAILQAAVVPVADARFGEVPFAFIRLRPSAALPEPAVLTAHCRARLAAFKIPRFFEAVDDFPLVGISKISKPLLRDRADRIVSSLADDVTGSLPPGT